MKVVHHLNHRGFLFGCCQTCKASSSKAPMDGVAIYALSLGFVSGDCLLATSGKSMSGSVFCLHLKQIFESFFNSCSSHNIPQNRSRSSWSQRTMFMSQNVLHNSCFGPCVEQLSLEFSQLVTTSQLQQHTSSKWWFQSFWIFTQILGQDEAILTSWCFNWVGSTTN